MTAVSPEAETTAVSPDTFLEPPAQRRSRLMPKPELGRFDHRGPQAHIPRHPLILRARGPIEYLNKKIACSRHADGLEQTHPEEAFT